MSKDRTLLNLAIGACVLKSSNRVAQDAVDSPYRAWFRMSIADDVQRALARPCGDRFIQTAGKPDFDQLIDYPCVTELPEASIDAAAEALRAGPQVLRLPRKHIVDPDSRLADLAGNIRGTFERQPEILKELP